MTPADLVRLFVRHRNAANLLMAVLLVLGGVGLFKLNTQFFPDFGIDVVTVSVEWPGASAQDVDRNIIEAIEPEVRYLDSVDKVISFATEGVGTVVIEYQQGTDMPTALSEAEAAVAQVNTLPEDSEKPRVKRVVRYDTIARLSLSGPYSEASLKVFAKRLREELLRRGIDRVTFFGARDEEIWVEVPPEALRRLDLTIADIAERIGASSLDLPSGTVEGLVEKQVRSLGLETTARGIAGIEIRALDNGQKIHLRDFARVSEAFDDKAPVGRSDGHPAIELHIQRSTAADALKVAETLEAFADEVLPTLPRDLDVRIYDVQSDLIRDRIAVLVKNGGGGLVLVLLVLFVFLSFRTAFWVALGIPVALFATFAVMLLTGQSINMVSLFALIMTLGIIVDDAIVVAEHAQTRHQAGDSALQAAETGALRMLAPVCAASLTTVAAFLPLFAIGDIIGTIIGAIPMVAVAVLLASLVECFLILPGHLRGSFRPVDERRSRPRAWFDDRFGRFRDGPFRRFVQMCLNWRYATFAGSVAMLLLAIGLLAGGRVAFNFFPSPEADVVYANVVMAPGTPRERMEAMVGELDRAADAAETALGGERGSLVRATLGTIGISQGRPFEALRGDRYGGLYLELQPSDHRSIRTAEFIAAWRAEIKPLAGLERVSLNERTGGPPGREVDLRLSGSDLDSLRAASVEIRALLERFSGISDVEDDLPLGKQEVILQVTPRGKALGFTTESVARQVRNAFQGAIAKRFARGDEEVTVRVRHPEDRLGTQALLDLYLRAPSGAEVPLSEVVSMREETGFFRVRRENGRREVAVLGEIDETVTTLNELLPALNEAGLEEIAARHGATLRLAGKAEEQERTLADMRFGAIVAMISIYIILAWVFASYGRPIVVMAIIPFGLVGAVLGHFVLGYDLSILSLVGLLGLSGILVNDSIILVSTIDERIGNGEPVLEAIVSGSQDRLRAVLLTSLTTIGGLTPLLFETSLQAQFLIPMAISIVFGLAVATLLVLVVVPALIGIQHDAVNQVRKLRAGFGRQRMSHSPTSDPS